MLCLVPAVWEGSAVGMDTRYGMPQK